MSEQSQPSWKTDLPILIGLILVGYFISGWLAFILFIVVIIIRGRGKKEDKKNAINEYNSVIFNNFQELGSTPEEREKKIRQMFDEKQKTIHFQYHWNHSEKRKTQEGNWVTENGCYKKISLSRNLASMDPREREFLRTAFLLFNDGKINNDNFRYYLFAFVYGNGKAGINEYNYLTYPENTGVKDGPTTAKYIMDSWDASVDSAINHLLKKIETLESENGNDRSVKEIKNRIRGGNAWLSHEELNGSIFNGSGSHHLHLGHLDETNTILNYSGEGSLITIAPPGSGKTQCFVIPNMLNWKGSIVVLDIKGEIYSLTSKWREKAIGRVIKFSPLDPANSNCYNPLSFIRKESDYIWEDSRFLADMMIVPSGSTDPFWENMARDVLSAAIAHVCFNNEPEERPMSKVLDLIYGIGWDDMISSLKFNLSVSAMRQTGHALGEMDKKQRDSVLKTAQSSLSAWQGERISRVTRKSDWSPMDLRKENLTIYICINPNEIDSYLSVLRVFIAQHIRMLTNELPPRGASPVLFMLDELPRLKKMPPVDEALNIGRQYGIKLWMFAQSYGQLKEAYPNPEGLLGSCVVRTFMNLPINDELTTKISDQLGYREGPLDASKQKLVEPIELAGPNYRDLILVLATNTKPAKVRKKFAYEDEEINVKLAAFN